MLQRRFFVILATAVALLGCKAPRSVTDEDRTAIEALIRDYCVAMTEAYRLGDVKALAAVATERERARVATVIAGLEEAGTAFTVTLRQISFDAIEVAGRTGFSVSTTETWDLRTVALGSDRTVGESLGQQNRIFYSVIRDSGRFVVLSRMLRSSSADS